MVLEGRAVCHRRSNHVFLGTQTLGQVLGLTWREEDVGLRLEQIGGCPCRDCLTKLDLSCYARGFPCGDCLNMQGRNCLTMFPIGVGLTWREEDVGLLGQIGGFQSPYINTLVWSVRLGVGGWG